ncbi:MAG: hypothetical protein IK115_03940 [Lachnospiraceae bacterium]|nr:hypothetical protein [Lachnospiraceae bacterium]
MTILDTTIRDGSYAVDFKFSCKDVQDLVAKSHRIGIEYIEIGHGLGLNASSLEHGFALQTDVEYMDAAREVAGDAKLGFFCIPGIARLEDIGIAKAHDMNFIRIGVTVKDAEKAKPYIAEGRKEGLEVFVNFMKTYSATPEEFASAAADMKEEGAGCVYIVDSAGSMSAGDIGEYIDATRTASDIDIGFHGHNNLGLAIDNTLYCVKKGIAFVDCSFQGLGRSLGNASLEQVVMVMERRGYSTGYDIPRVLEYGYSGLRNIVNEKLVNPLDYMCGYAGFHSSFLKDIYRCCNEKQVDPLRLIMAYSAENKMTMDYARLCEVADSLPIDKDDNPYSFAEFFSERYRE